MLALNSFRLFRRVLFRQFLLRKWKVWKFSVLHVAIFKSEHWKWLYVAKFMRLFWLGGHLSWPVWCSWIDKENTAPSGLSFKWLGNVQNDSHHSAPLKPPPLTPHLIISHLISPAHSSGRCRGGREARGAHVDHGLLGRGKTECVICVCVWFYNGIPKIIVKLVLLKCSRPSHLPV